MRLFGYYALHSVKNQLKKLFKTWVMIFLLACMLIGGLIGVGAASLEDAAEERNAIEYAEEIDETENWEEEWEEDWEEDAILVDDIYGTIELIAGGIILAFFVFQAIGADKNGSKIFLPADVNLLFASPMKPQSVLMFRLMCQMGVILLSSIYLGFQVPNLVINLDMGLWAAVGVLLTWLFTVAIGKLIQIFLYIYFSSNAGLKKYLRNGIYGFGGGIAGAYFLYTAASGLDYFSAALQFFNHDITRWIPFWGWIKGFCMFCMEGNLLGALVSLAVIFVGGGLLVTIIWRLKADFYEDAMAKSEETAQLLEAAQSEKSSGFVKRKKDRSEKLRRDGMNRGSGANVFFWRIMYNRFRFAHFGIFTKTSETYLVAAAGISLCCKFVLETDGLIPVILALGVLTFYRTLGNPLAEDTSKDFFRMIPESTGKKLFWSVLGGTVNCLLDLIPAILLIELIYMVNPLVLLAWIPFILSVDFFGSNVGAFINLSVPVSAGTIIKQIVMVMFLYFGLLPDIAIMAVGIVFEQVEAAAVICAAVNFGLGMLFLALTPLFLEAKERPVREKAVLSEEECSHAKKAFSRLGLGCFAIILVASMLQAAAVVMLPDRFSNSWAMWVYTFAPIYLFAVPVGLLIFRKVPKRELPKHDFSAGQMIKIGLISIFMMYAGNLVGTLVTTVIGILQGTVVEAAITEYALADSFVLKILFLVILAPVIEEYVFRKQLIDRMSCYGEKLAVILSALMFGMFHGNFSQLFYAFSLGLVFGYVYLKTGKLRYSIGLHMLINFLGSVVSTALLEGINLEALDSAGTVLPQELLTPGLIIFLCYVLGMLLAAIVGLVLLCRNSRKIIFESAELELPKGKCLKITCVNAGMILFAGVCLAMIAVSLL